MLLGSIWWWIQRIRRKHYWDTIKQVVENHLEEEMLLKENPGAPKVQWEGWGREQKTAGKRCWGGAQAWNSWSSSISKCWSTIWFSFRFIDCLYIIYFILTSNWFLVLGFFSLNNEGWERRDLFFSVLLYGKWCKVQAFVQSCYSVISEKALVSDLKVDLTSKNPYVFQI